VADKWPTIRRDDYLRMADRHLPFSAALMRFIVTNKVKSIVEIGCGPANLSHLVDDYTGIDTNEEVLRDNALNYGHGTWINDDWRNVDATTLMVDLFVSSSVIEHCESFEPFLEWVNRLASPYSVVTFHKGLRNRARIRRDKLPPLFDNHYCRADVQGWLSRNIYGQWNLYDLPLSRARFRNRKDSVLVIDRTGKADLSMWEKKELHGS